MTKAMIELTLRVANSIGEVAAPAWDACANAPAPVRGNGGGVSCAGFRQDTNLTDQYNPFISHDFLSALELSQSVRARAGWYGRARQNTNRGALMRFRIPFIAGVTGLVAAIWAAQGFAALPPQYDRWNEFAAIANDSSIPRKLGLHTERVKLLRTAILPEMVAWTVCRDTAVSALPIKSQAAVGAARYQPCTPT